MPLRIRSYWPLLTPAGATLAPIVLSATAGASGTLTLAGRAGVTLVATAAPSSTLSLSARAATAFASSAAASSSLTFSGLAGIPLAATTSGSGTLALTASSTSNTHALILAGTASGAGVFALTATTLIPLRTWAYSMLAQAVREALPGAAVERDRTPPIGLDRLPAVFVSTGDHTAGEPALGEVALECQMTVAWRGWAATAAARTDAAYEAHGAVAAALGRRFTIQGQPVWPIQSDFALDLEGGEQSGAYLVGWSATWSFELLAPIGDVMEAV